MERWSTTTFRRFLSLMKKVKLARTLQYIETTYSKHYAKGITKTSYRSYSRCGIFRRIFA